MCNFPEISLLCVILRYTVYSLPKNHPLPPKGRKKIKVVVTLRKPSEKKILFQNIKNKQKLLKRGKKIVAFDRDVKYSRPTIISKIVL